VVCVVAGSVATLFACAVSAPAAQSLNVSKPTYSTFVPNWDGENDSTCLTYRVGTRSRVTVSVRDSATKSVVRVLERSQLRGIGRHTVCWDGRTDTGATVASGSYAIAVVARPVAQAGTARAGATIKATGSQAIVTVQTPPLALQNLSIGSAVASRVSHRATHASVTLSRAGRITAAVVDGSGKVVRNLPSGYRKAGPISLAWDGTTDKRKPVRDGVYEVWVTGSASRVPTNTMQIPVRIDSVRPKITAVHSKVFTKLVGSGLHVKLGANVGEAGYLVLHAVGGRKGGGTRIRVAKGTKSLTLTSWQLGFGKRVKAGTYRVKMTAIDQAGNFSSSIVTIVAKGTTPPPAPKPPTVPSQPTTPTQNPPTAPTGKMAWPLASFVITSPFGQRDGRMHTGADLAAPSGTTIFAANEGVVTFAGTMGGYGKLVIIEHPNGLSTYYAHQSKIVAVQGTIVSRGQSIGYVGTTGNSTGPHLHFEVRVGGIPKNPIPYLPAR
jgi:flagellar hook assembly protein FlgD